jgi:hypothetical protein
MSPLPHCQWVTHRRRTVPECQGEGAALRLLAQLHPAYEELVACKTARPAEESSSRSQQV